MLPMLKRSDVHREVKIFGAKAKQKKSLPVKLLLHVQMSRLALRPALAGRCFISLYKVDSRLDSELLFVRLCNKRPQIA
jgi:hypothetical protein